MFQGSPGKKGRKQTTHVGTQTGHFPTAKVDQGHVETLLQLCDAIAGLFLVSTSVSSLHDKCLSKHVNICFRTLG